jgi:hypothetical protein
VREVLENDTASLLAQLAQEVEKESDLTRAGVRAAETKAAERLAEPYPPETLKKTEAPAEQEDEEDDEFALPVATQTRTEAYSAPDGPNGAYLTAAEAGRDPYESLPPQRIQAAELQKALFHAKLIVMHTFEYDKTPAGASILQVIKAEKPEVYADIIARCGISLFIGWQKGMGM